jgi:radical SAM superfamily enzyme YgiQ (UPF0313 family)
VKAPGAILLIACYELGHQPLAVAWPAAFLERRGYAPAVVDISVEPLDPEQVRRAHLVAISVPMHTALRLGVTIARRVREINPTSHICFYGLYATLNADELLTSVADTVLAGELEEELVGLVQELENTTVDGPAPPIPPSPRPCLRSSTSQYRAAARFLNSSVTRIWRSMAGWNWPAM